MYVILKQPRHGYVGSYPWTATIGDKNVFFERAEAEAFSEKLNKEDLTKNVNGLFEYSVFLACLTTPELYFWGS